MEKHNLIKREEAENLLEINHITHVNFSATLNVFVFKTTEKPRKPERNRIHANEMFKNNKYQK